MVVGIAETRSVLNGLLKFVVVDGNTYVNFIYDVLQRDEFYKN
jgi:hypothetical protein